MPRSKLKLAYISNDSAGKATFRKRQSGLMKKANEIKILYDIEACLIIFSPYSPDPDVWPSQLGAQHVISRFRNMPPPEQDRKRVDHESYAQQSLEKMNEKVMRQRRENQHSEMTQIMYQCLAGIRGFEGLTMGDLNQMSALVSQNLWEIDRRLGFFQRGPHNG